MTIINIMKLLIFINSYDKVIMETIKTLNVKIGLILDKNTCKTFISDNTHIERINLCDKIEISSAIKRIENFFKIKTSQLVISFTNLYKLEKEMFVCNLLQLCINVEYLIGKCNNIIIVTNKSDIFKNILYEGYSYIEHFIQILSIKYRINSLEFTEMCTVEMLDKDLELYNKIDKWDLCDIIKSLNFYLLNPHLYTKIFIENRSSRRIC